MASIQGFDQLAQALQQLGWCSRGATIELVDSRLQSNCWLRRWLAGPQSGWLLNADGHRQFLRLVTAGWSLRSEWPRNWGATVAEWLGGRFYFGHASLFSNANRYHSLISSRIGRDGNQYPQWPQWIDRALRHVQRTGGQLLIVPDTTLAASVAQFASTAQLPATNLAWAQTSDVTAWLQTILTTLADPASINSMPAGQLHISPPLEAPSETLAGFPLQDRLAMALADRVLAMTLRPGGRLADLVQLRLANPNFPTGTLFVTLAQATSRPACKSRAATAARNSASVVGWLNRGAVGWIVVNQPVGLSDSLQHCRLPQAAGRPGLQQLTAPLPAHWRAMAATDDWPYLVHCTRGNSGRQLEESQGSFRQRAWSQGEARGWHPLETLAQICRDGRLRSAAGMTRTCAACVSFSAVPIVPLLRRRTFRAHLSRWDWEPYGVLIHRTSLQTLRARPVIYGTESDFKQLSHQDKALFQPNWRKRADETWSDEREWRVLGDVDLHALPSPSVSFFVRTKSEAQQFARHSPWPVLWVE